MDEPKGNGNAFAIPYLWKKSSMADFDRSLTAYPTALGLEPLELQGGHDSVLSPIKNLEFHLPDLPSFDYGPIEIPAIDDASSISSVTASCEITNQLEDNVWSFPNIAIGEQTSGRHESWEAFYDGKFQEPRIIYISEAGPRAFDAALAAGSEIIETGSSGNPGNVIQSTPLLTGLLQLSLGRESTLYRYSETKQSFYPVIEDGRMSGYSPEAFGSLNSSLVDAGNKFRHLQRFIEKTHSSNSSSPTLVALASSFSNILADLQSRLGNPSIPVCSLLQLQWLLERPKSILNCLSDVVRKCKDEIADERLLSKLYENIYDLEHTDPWLRPLLLQLLASTSKPWLDSVNSWLGFEIHSAFEYRDQSRLPSFVRSEEVIRKTSTGKEAKALEYEFETLSMPTFMDKEDSEVIFETGQYLRLLEAHQPDHPLVRLPVNATHCIGLEWHFSWKDVERIQAQAKAYESALKTAIDNFESHGIESRLLYRSVGCETQDVGVQSKRLSEESAKTYIRTSIDAFEKPLPKLNGLNGNVSSDDLGSFYEHNLPVELFAPPTSLLPALSFSSLISTQAHLASQACLRLLFKEYGLRSNLQLLYRYNLFGDGVFASALSHALFDPDFQTTERRKGQSRAGNSGLKLGSRDTWPPASSELRLALMGILAESYHQKERINGASSMFRGELPGGLSFSIREMSEDELQRCMNPDSIEALDFLKLDYRPSSPLDTVITQSSLLKYDAIFKLLLRAARMLFVVNQLFRDIKARSTDGKDQDLLVQSFRVESYQFVSATCRYFFDGVTMNWHRLEEKLVEIERRLDQDGTESLSQLREFHEQTLDRMMFALILRKRQAQVMKLLEDIFGLVLQFARQVRTRNRHFGMDSTDDKSELRGLFGRFRKKVRVFVNVCRGLSERRGLSKDGHKDEEEENTMGHLLLKLDFSGFYTTDQQNYP